MVNQIKWLAFRVTYLIVISCFVSKYLYFFVSKLIAVFAAKLLLAISSCFRYLWLIGSKGNVCWFFFWFPGRNFLSDFVLDFLF